MSTYGVLVSGLLELSAQVRDEFHVVNGIACKGTLINMKLTVYFNQYPQEYLYASGSIRSLCIKSNNN